MAYGSIAGVQELVGDIVQGRTFTDDTTPSTTTVQSILDSVEAIINVELKQQGYAIPVTSSDDAAHALLIWANDCGAAARTLSTIPTESFTNTESEGFGGSRREMLDRELHRTLERIKKRELPAAKDAAGITGQMEFINNGNDRLFSIEKFNYESI